MQTKIILTEVLKNHCQLDMDNIVGVTLPHQIPLTVKYSAPFLSDDLHLLEWTICLYSTENFTFLYTVVITMRLHVYLYTRTVNALLLYFFSAITREI